MRFLFITISGDFLPVALRVKEEGNEVAVWIKSNRARRLGVYSGILDEIYPTLQAAFEALGYEPDAVIFDQIGLGDLADELRDHGLPVWGASKVADKLEKDRLFGLRVMEQAGISIPLTSPHLQSLQDAQSFIRQHSDISRWVVKFEGENAPHSTVIGEPEEVLDAIDTLLGEGAGIKFILQQFVEGVEISTEIWVSGGQIVDPANATLETKRYLSGDIGPNTGCMTSIVWAYEETPHIVMEGIGKLEDWLAEQSYNGPIDLNSIVNDEGVWGLEWTPRHGYNAVYALFELFDDDIGRVLADAARGQLKFMPVRIDDAAYAIRIYIPPAPFTDSVTGDIFERLKQLEKKDEDVKAIAEALERVGIEVSFQRGTGEVAGVELKEVAAGELIELPENPTATIWLLDVKRDNRSGRLVTAGLDGIIAEVSAAAPRLSEAVRWCEQTVKEIKLAGKCWRNDGHLRAFDAAVLRGMGYEVPDSVFK